MLHQGSTSLKVFDQKYQGSICLYFESICHLTTQGLSCPSLETFHSALKKDDRVVHIQSEILNA